MLRGVCLLAVLLASAAAFPLECGWPALHKGGRYGPSTVRLAQRLLGHALDQPLPVDGNWSDATEDATKAFQLQAGLPITGALDATTWPQLSASCLPLTAGANGSLVSGLQESLIFNGFDTNVSGIFDLQTQDKLGAFQRARGASRSSGDALDEQTWHLLVSGCNASAATAAYWFDAGWPQGALALEQLQCLRSTGFEFATFECWVERGYGMFWEECVGNIARAQIAGLKVGAYMFPHRSVDATLQVQQLVGNLSAFNVTGVRQIMIDIEGGIFPTWSNFSWSENQAYVLQLRGAIEAAGFDVTVYGGAWDSYFGNNFTAFSDRPFVYAHYDNVPSFYDYVENPVGGWKSAAGKQFWDGVDGESVCDADLDWDWSPAPFW